MLISFTALGIAACTTSGRKSAHSPLPEPTSMPKSESSSGQGTIIGEVRTATGQRVDGALVAVVPAGATEFGALAARTTSDQKGGFEFRGLPFGKYGVTATISGSAAAYVGNIQVRSPDTIHISVEMGGDGVVVSGRVRDLAGRPVTSGLVAALRSSSEDADTFFVEVGKDARYSITLPRAGYSFLLKGDYLSDPQFLDDIASPKTVDILAEPIDAELFAGRAVIEAIRRSLVSLSAPSAPIEDSVTDRIRDIIGSATVVGLGECGHGGHEFGTEKKRLIQVLVEHMNFRTVAVEASWSDSLALDAYVQTGQGDAARLLAGMRFWITNTEEMLDLVQWIRSYNEHRAPSERVHFFGIDMQSAPTSVQLLTEYLLSLDRSRAEALRRDLTEAGDEFLSNQWDSVPDRIRKRHESALLVTAKYLDDKKRAFIARTSESAWTEARHHVDVLLQWLAMNSAGIKSRDVRDRAMAENVRWLHTLRPAKVIVWADNSHISREPYVEFRPMGSHLREWFGENYRPIGFVFNEGSFRAGDVEGAREIFTLPPARAGSIEGTVARAAHGERAIVDLRQLLPTADEWKHLPLHIRFLGASWGQSWGDFGMRIHPIEAFDALVWIRSLTPCSRRFTPLELEYRQGGAHLPGPWKLAAGSISAGYRATLHRDREQERVAITRDNRVHYPGYGWVYQSADLAAGHAKRMEFAVDVATGSDSKARLCVFVHNAQGNVTVFKWSDEIQSVDWGSRSVRVDVPADAKSVVYGIAVVGNSATSFRSWRLDAQPKPE